MGRFATLTPPKNRFSREILEETRFSQDALDVQQPEFEQPFDPSEPPSLEEPPRKPDAIERAFKGFTSSLAKVPKAILTKSRAFGETDTLLETMNAVKEFKEFSGREPTGEEFKDLLIVGKHRVIKRAEEIFPESEQTGLATGVGQLAGFVTKLAATRAFFGSSPAILNWELQGELSGQAPGTGAAEFLILNAVTKSGKAVFRQLLKKFPKFNRGWQQWVKGKSVEEVRSVRQEVEEALRIKRETGDRTAWDEVRIKIAGIPQAGAERIRARTAPPPPVKDFGKFPLAKAKPAGKLPIRPTVTPPQPPTGLARAEKVGVKPEVGIKVPPKAPETVTEAVVKIGNQTFEGITHAEAAQKAVTAGIAQFNDKGILEKVGDPVAEIASDLFRTSKGRIIDRIQASKLTGGKLFAEAIKTIKTARPTEPPVKIGKVEGIKAKTERLRIEAARLRNKLEIEEGKLSSFRAGRDIRGKITERKKEAHRAELGRRTKEVELLRKESETASKAFRLFALQGKEQPRPAEAKEVQVKPLEVQVSPAEPKVARIETESILDGFGYNAIDKEGNVIGRALVTEIDDKIRITGFFVKEEFRRKRVGTAIVNEIKKDYPDKEILPYGVETKEGKKFLDKVLARPAPLEEGKKAAELSPQKAFDIFKKNLPDATEPEIVKAMIQDGLEPPNEVLERNKDLPEVQEIFAERETERIAKLARPTAEAKPKKKVFFEPAKQKTPPEVPPPIDITQEPPGAPSAEFGESFIKRVTRRAEAGLRVGKEYETPKSLVPLEKEAVSKLETAIQLSQKEKAVIAKEKKIYQRQRVAQAHRFLKIEKAKGELTAEERLAATVKFFKDEQFVKQRWEPIKLVQATRNSMHEYIETHQGFGLHTKRNTSEALNKLFDGYYLTNHEVAYITDVFPELGKAAAKRRPPRNKGFDIFMSVLGFPKSVRAAFDISLLGRQMYPLLLAKPSLIAPGTRESLKLFFRKKSAAFATALSAEMRADPAWKRAEDMGVEVIKPGELSEEFPTRVAGKIPGIARSERAFVQTGNLLRVAAHDMIENAYIERGKPLSDDASKAMAQAINDLSGRSALPKNLKGLSTVASAVMWSPRLVLARGKAPFRIFSKQRAARNLTIRSFTTMASLVTLLMLLAKYGHERNEDIDGELNPISTDFGKIRYKNQHIDTTGGYGPMLRTVARVVTGMTKTTTGEIIKKDRIETLKQFGRAKTAPFIGFARKVITQQDWLGRPAFRAPSGTIGEKMTELGIPEAGQIVAKELYEELLPLPMVDVADAAYIDGWASGLIAAPLAFGGVGTLTYEQAESVKLRIEQNKVAQRVHGKNWDELGPLQQRFLIKEQSILNQQLKADVENLYQRQEGEIDKVRYKMYRSMPLPIRKELDSIGVAISAPARKSGDFRMNDARYKRYVDTSTKLMQSAFEREFAISYWQNKSTLLSFKQKRVNQIMTNAKTRARNEVKRLSNEGKL